MTATVNVARETFEVRPFAAAPGAEVRCGGLRTISGAVFAQLHRAWLDHLVVLVRGQDLSALQDLLAFGRRSGPIERAPDAIRQLDCSGFQARPTTPEQYGALTQSEIEKWAKVIRTADMRAD